MNIKIEDMIQEESGKTRMYYSSDNSDLKTLLLEDTDLLNINTVENAIKKALKSKEYVGHSFDI